MKKLIKKLNKCLNNKVLNTLYRMVFFKQLILNILINNLKNIEKLKEKWFKIEQIKVYNKVIDHFVNNLKIQKLMIINGNYLRNRMLKLLWKKKLLRKLILKIFKINQNKRERLIVNLKYPKNGNIEVQKKNRN